MLKVTPKATTTYTLTVTGVNGTLTKTVTVNVAGTTPVAATTSVPLNQQAAPRTADGKPDLTGVYGYGADRGAALPHRGAAGARCPAPPTLKPGAEKRGRRGRADWALLDMRHRACPRPSWSPTTCSSCRRRST